MTPYPIHRSQADTRSRANATTNPSLRALAYGPIRPMHEPSLWERLLGRR